MKYNSDIHNRQSIRLKGFDYSKSGVYFITICTFNRECLFGNIENGKMILSGTGEIADKFWLDIPVHYPFVKLYEYVIMPNHIHGIIEICSNHNSCCRDAINRVPTNNVLTNNIPTTNRGHIRLNPFSLSVIVRWFKGRTKFEVNKLNNNINFRWQSRFYDHIVRNDNDLNRVREYVINNPLKWNEDDYYKD